MRSRALQGTTSGRAGPGWDEPTAVHPEENEEEPHIDEDPAVFPVNGLKRVPKPIPVAGNAPVPLSVDWACVGRGVAVTTGAAGVGATVVTTIVDMSTLPGEEKNSIWMRSAFS